MVEVEDVDVDVEGVDVEVEVEDVLVLVGVEVGLDIVDTVDTEVEDVLDTVDIDVFVEVLAVELVATVGTWNWADPCTWKLAPKERAPPSEGEPHCDAVFAVGQ
jgi:hypothetical protein